MPWPDEGFLKGFEGKTQMAQISQIRKMEGMAEQEFLYKDLTYANHRPVLSTPLSPAEGLSKDCMDDTDFGDQSVQSVKSVVVGGGTGENVAR